MTGPLHCGTHVKPGESPPSLTSVPSPRLSTYKEIPNSEQTPWHQGFRTPHLLLYSCPKLSPFKLRNASHICPFLFRPIVIIQRCIIFLLDFSDPVLLASPFISNVHRKVLLRPSFTHSFVMLGPHQNPLRWLGGCMSGWWGWVLPQINWAILLLIHFWDSLAGSYLPLCFSYRSYCCEKPVILMRVLCVLRVCCVNEVWNYCTKLWISWKNIHLSLISSA